MPRRRGPSVYGTGPSEPQPDIWSGPSRKLSSIPHLLVNSRGMQTLNALFGVAYDREPLKSRTSLGQLLGNRADSISERRACGLIGMHCGSWRYQRRERNEAVLRARLRELAAEGPRFGYRRLYIFLRREKNQGGKAWWRGSREPGGTAGDGKEE